MIKISLSKWSTRFVYFICSIILLVQIRLISYAYFWPEKMSTVLIKEDLKSIIFPVIFRVCVIPGIDKEMVSKAGYNNYGYFVGMSRFNSSVLGWTGHSEDGSMNLTSEGME